MYNTNRCQNDAPEYLLLQYLWLIIKLKRCLVYELQTAFYYAFYQMQCRVALLTSIKLEGHIQHHLIFFNAHINLSNTYTACILPFRFRVCNSYYIWLFLTVGHPASVIPKSNRHLVVHMYVLRLCCAAWVRYSQCTIEKAYEVGEATRNYASKLWFY